MIFFTILFPLLQVMSSLLYNASKNEDLWQCIHFTTRVVKHKETKYNDNSKYIWEPGDKYRQLCDIIQNNWNNSDYKKLYYRVEYGGFGNQMYTISSMLVLGALSDHVPMYDYPEYGEIMGGCYSANIISMDQHLGKTLRCKPYTSCYNNKEDFWSPELIANSSVIFSAPLMDSTRFFSPQNIEVLSNLFKHVIPDFSAWNVRRDLMRLWFNPSDSLRMEILEEKARLITRPHLIGLNLRMGGVYANFPEEYVGIPITRLSDIAKQVHAYIDLQGWDPRNVTLYISSDSTKAIKRMSDFMNRGTEVVESKLYTHGHTKRSMGPLEYIMKMKKVVADMYYMAISEYRFVSWQSSFGRIICHLSDEHTCEPVLGWKNTNKKVRIPSV